MAQRNVAQRPSDLHDLCARLSVETDAEIHLTLQLYKPLTGTHIEALDTTFGARVLEPLYYEWTNAIRDANLPTPGHGPLTAALRFIVDITRPLMPDPNATNFIQYEARALMRITGLLHSKFRDRGALEGTIIGAPCWCLLNESEKHIALPKGRSWPVSRASHVKAGDSRSNAAATCVRLAREHWDDEHWGRD